MQEKRNAMGVELYTRSAGQAQRDSSDYLTPVGVTFCFFPLFFLIECACFCYRFARIPAKVSTEEQEVEKAESDRRNTSVKRRKKKKDMSSTASSANSEQGERERGPCVRCTSLCKRCDRMPNKGFCKTHSIRFSFFPHLSAYPVSLYGGFPFSFCL